MQDKQFHEQYLMVNQKKEQIFIENTPNKLTQQKSSSSNLAIITQNQSIFRFHKPGL